MVHYIEACGYRHLAVNNRLYLGRLSILMLLSDSHNIYWFFLWRHIWMYRVLVHSGDVGVFQCLHIRDPVETYGTINYETTYQGNQREPQDIAKELF